MKKFLLIFSFFLLAFSNGRAQMPLAKQVEVMKKIPSAENMLSNGSTGRDFWIAIEPNEGDNCKVPTVGLKIYVTSSKDCNVTLEAPYEGYKVTKPVKATEITTFSDADQETKWSWEVLESEQVTSKGIRLTADQPIAVYVFSNRVYTSDGYMALPVNVLGTEYMHCSYWDFNDPCPRGGGFLVVATEDATKISYTLAGQNYGGPLGRTEKNNPIGSSSTVTLKKGQTYMVRGNGKASGKFDISGTKVTSNKPISFISFHQRTIMPIEGGGGISSRDHLVEMLPPITAWGKSFVTMEFKRGKQNGDFYRIIAAEDNTTYSMTQYDISNFQQIGKKGGTLKAGEFNEFVRGPFVLGTSVGIKGVCVWTADKPILVMQYGYSQAWDQAGQAGDPTMVWSVPKEQYTLGTVFETPTSSSFTEHFFNLFAIADTTDPGLEKLKTIELDGKKITTYAPKFLINRVPGTNIHYARIPLPTGTHKIKGETPFGGVIYGFGVYDGYAWPAATAINKINETDTLPPVLTNTVKCGDYDYLATELRDGDEKDTLRQIDQGISQIELMEDVSYNYSLKLVTMDPIVPDPKVAEFKFKLNVINKREKAKAVFIVMDRRGNFTIDSVFYAPDSLYMSPQNVSFGKVRVGRTKEMTVDIVNPTDSVMTVNRLYLKDNSLFRIVDGFAPPVYQIAPKTSKRVKIAYTPTEEIKNDQDFDIDSVFAETNCLKFWLGEVRGQGVMPHIRVGDVDAGIILVGTKRCNEGMTPPMTDFDGMLVKNVGTDTLTVFSVSGVQAPFTLSNPTVPPLAFKVAPKSEIILKKICFEPLVVGKTSQEITLNCDTLTADDDNVSHWEGVGINDEPVITDFDWKERRQLTVNEPDSSKGGILKVFNFGTAGISLDSVSQLNNPNFTVVKIKYEEIEWKAGQFMGRYIAGGGKDSILIYVRFKPQDTLTYFDSVKAYYSTATKSDMLKGEVRGIGILPDCSPLGHTFAPILIGTTSTETGYVTIDNKSGNKELAVSEVRFANMTSPDAFVWSAGAITKNFVIGRHQSVKIPVTYKANALINQADVEIISDYKTGPTDSIGTKVVVLKGNAFTVGAPDILATGFAAPATLYCNESVGEISIKSTGTNPLTVTDLAIEGAATPAFDFIAKPTLPLTLLPGEVQKIGIKYSPNAMNPRPNTSRNDIASVRIVNNGSKSGDTSVALTGSSYVVPATFKLADMTGKKLMPGEIIAMPLVVESPNYADANITKFETTISYQASDIRLESVAGLNGWTVTMDNSTPGNIVIRGSGPAVKSNQPIANLNFSVYLSLLNEFPINFVSAPVTERELCVDISTINGKIYPAEYCARNVRNLIGGQFDYSLAQNSPNPTVGFTEISYSVGLSGQVKIALYNALGEEVKVFVNGYREAGEYKIIVNDDLNGGLYYYRMMAGDFMDTKKMMIQK